jgi:hypothetical protein
MHKSFIERIFPQSSNPLLPTSRRERRSPRVALPSTPSPIISASSLNPSRSRHASPHESQSLQPTPLSASIIHHTDPLLPVDRAARALQKTIQSLLDAQSDGLAAGLGAGSRDDISSVGSLTPTPSIATPPRSTVGPRTTPVRQPTPKKISLRGARKGLTRSMQDFTQLKEEELRILDSQFQGRQSALDKVKAFEGKRSALQSQVDTIKQEGLSKGSAQLHKEAESLAVEIQELEDKLFELRARQRHILAQASQAENAVSSKLSAYTSSLELLDREIKQYLRQPPLQATTSAEAGTGQSMYDLKPERRTLAMAKEQWSNEASFLSSKRSEALQEKAALQAGSAMWRETVSQITLFEKDLRAATQDLSHSQSQSPLPPDSAEKNMHALLPALDSTITTLKLNLRHAESHQWNLLICCLGPELEAFIQARSLLRQTLGLPPLIESPEPEVDAESDGPPHDLMNGRDIILQSPSGESNRSLEDTLEAFAAPDLAEIEDGSNSAIHLRHPPTQTDSSRGLGFGFGPTTIPADSESEEDDPGPDFLLSHS